MNELEDRLSEALRQGADDAPIGDGLADGARRRVGQRRRQRYAAVGVAAVLAVALGSGALAVRGHDQPASPTAQPRPEPVGPAAGGYRWETWHGVSVEVPDGWTNASLSSWCTDGASVPSRVQRPEDPTLDILCTPQLSYGLTFTVASKPGLNWPVAEQSNDVYPKGAYVGTRDLDGVLVEVATPSQALSQRVLDSVVTVLSADANGCAPTLAQSGELTQVGWVAVCGYDADGALVRSRGLDLKSSTAARAEVEDAVPGAAAGCPAQPTGPVTRMVASDLDATVDLDRGCLYVGPNDEPLVLTDAIRELALTSPGAG